jgi:hypothetical protein
MNRGKAVSILQIPDQAIITEDVIKKHYRMMALKYHPDKNQDESAKNMFHEVQEAYEFMCGENIEEHMEENKYNTDYDSFLYVFLEQTIKDDFQKKIMYMLISKILKKTSNKFLDISAEFLRKIDKSILKKIYDFLKYYSDIFHYSLNFLEKIRELIDENQIKNNNTINTEVEPERIILHPLLEDLFENNLYKLKNNQHVILVPLWHHELVYDLSGEELYVECYPILEENISIDEINDIHVSLEYDLVDIWEKQGVEFKLGNIVLTISRDEITMSDFQTIILREKGISRINQDDIYNILEKGDIYVHIKISH